jgi:hypothetical protein
VSFMEEGRRSLLKLGNGRHSCRQTSFYAHGGIRGFDRFAPAPHEHTLVVMSEQKSGG